jgi:transposase InsO family protein
MSAKGNPDDNAFMDSFYKTLKYEDLHFWNAISSREAPLRL